MESIMVKMNFESDIFNVLMMAVCPNFGKQD